MTDLTEREQIVALTKWATEADRVAAMNDLEASGMAIVPVEAVNYEELSIQHGQQVTVTFKDSADAFALFDEIDRRGKLAAAKDQADGR